MTDIALYYPYIHIRDDRWLKAAALYWPRLARLAPPGYPRFDSDVARALDNELGLLLNIEPPAKQVAAVATDFLQFVHTHRRQLQDRYSPGAEGDCSPLWHDAWFEMMEVNHGWHALDDGLIHVRKMTDMLREELVDLGLGKLKGDHHNWLVVHPVIGAAYTMALIDRVAVANDLAVVTDQPRLHEVHAGANGDPFISALLESDPDSGPIISADDVAAMYATIAIRTVVPANLEHVPVDKIVKARRTLAVEFDVFREHLDTLAQDFVALASIENRGVLEARLQMMVDRNLRRPAAALERSLRQQGLEPAAAVLGLKTLELPAIAAAAGSALAVPLAASQAGLVTAPTHHSQPAIAVSAASDPAQWTGRLFPRPEKHLGSRGMINRIRHAWRRVTSLD